jgi:hypothetical protein
MQQVVAFVKRSMSNSTSWYVVRDSLAFVAASTLMLGALTTTTSLASDIGNGPTSSQASCSSGSGQGQVNVHCSSSSSPGSQAPAPGQADPAIPGDPATAGAYQEGVLGASTAPVFSIGATVTTAAAPGRTARPAAVAGLASMLDPGKGILLLVWLALNAGFVLIRKRRGGKAADVFRPITLGGWTYGSRAGLGA